MEQHILTFMNWYRVLSKAAADDDGVDDDGDHDDYDDVIISY